MEVISDFLSGLPEGALQILSIIAICFSVAVWVLGKILTKIAKIVLLLGLSGLGYNLYSEDTDFSKLWTDIQEKGIMATMFEEEDIKIPNAREFIPQKRQE